MDLMQIVSLFQQDNLMYSKINVKLKLKTTKWSNKSHQALTCTPSKKNDRKEEIQGIKEYRHT